MSSSGSARDFWLYNTMLIENEWGGQGTGFLLFRPDKPEGNEGRVFLITNKHVPNPDPKKRDQATKITLHFNIQDQNKRVLKGQADIQIKFGNSKSYKEHQSVDVDVIAFEVTDLIALNPSIQRQIATSQMLLTPDKIKDWDIKSGDQINVVGYPAGIRHRMTNFPIVRSGIISSMIGEELEDDFKSPDGILRKRILRGFLVDGAIIPGSSGSPVVLPSISFRNVGEKLQIQNFPLLILGIIAKTRIAPIVTPTIDYLSFAGLGLAFDAQTIIETIELFYV